MNDNRTDSNRELLRELKSAFDRFKKDYDFFMDFEDFDRAYGIGDHVMNMGYIPQNLPRFIVMKLIDAYNSWLSYLHNVIMPNPNSMISHEESSIFADDEKKDLMEMIKKLQYHVSIGFGFGLGDDKQVVNDFLEATKRFYPDFLKNKRETIQKSQEHWRKSAGY